MNEETIEYICRNVSCPDRLLRSGNIYSYLSNMKNMLKKDPYGPFIFSVDYHIETLEYAETEIYLECLFNERYTVRLGRVSYAQVKAKKFKVRCESEDGSSFELKLNVNADNTPEIYIEPRVFLDNKECE